MTSYRSSIDNIALNYLVFEKITFFAFWRQTDEQMDATDALSCSRCRGLIKEINYRVHKIWSQHETTKSNALLEVGTNCLKNTELDTRIKVAFVLNFIFMPPQLHQRHDIIVLSTVASVPSSVYPMIFLSLCKNTECISMKFMGYHHQIKWLHFRQNWEQETKENLNWCQLVLLWSKRSADA